MPSRLVRYDVAGHTHFWTISCYRRLTFFWHDAVKRIVVDALHVLQERFRICLIGYVIMPEHVHVLLYPHARGHDAPIPISQLLYAFKKHVGFHGKEILRQMAGRDGALWSRPISDWINAPRPGLPLWTPRGYDFNVDRYETLREKLDYRHKNPITRGLVSRPEDWTWSSYRFYELDDRSTLCMDWDGRWPIVW